MKRILAILSTTLFMASQSAYPATDIQLSISSATDLPVEVEVEWSPELTGVIDLIATSNLHSNNWELVFIDSIPAGITNLYWIDEGPSSSRFFTAGNGHFDSDGDLLSNAQEFLDYLTDPRDPDTDKDGLEDGDETHGDGSFGDTDGFITNPFLPDRANYNLPEFTALGPTDDLNGFPAFDPPSGGSVATNAPAIAEWTRSNGPDDTMALTGERFSDHPYGNDSYFIFFSQTAENRNIQPGKINRLDGRQAAITLPETLPQNQMYLMWPLNQNGWGKPVAINQTDAWWIGPDKTSQGETFSIFGRNLIADQDLPVSYAYLENSEGNGEWLTSVSANPYRADFILPSNKANGTYTVWAHNGLGHAYGWSRSLELIVEDPIIWDGPTFNVMDYGAAGDGVSDDWSAIKDALEDAKNADFATVYFPEGTYLISASLHDAKYDMRLMGDGMDQTIISTHPNYGSNSSYNYGLFFCSSQIGPVEYRDMTISSGSHIANSSIGATLLYARNGTQGMYNNVRFTQLDNPDHTTHKPIIDMESSSRMVFRNCEFILAGSVDVNRNSRQIVFEGCTFKGINDNEFMINIGASRQCRVTQCLAMNYDNSNLNDGHGWAQGRFVYGSGGKGRVSEIYYSDNATSNLTVRETFTANQNTGEQYMMEFGRTLFRGRPTGASTTDVTLSSLPEDFTDKIIVIAGGRGIGQNRVIESVSGNTVTVDQHWRVAPDANSIVMIGNFARRHVVYNNIFDGVERAVVTDTPSTAGVMPYGSQVDMVVDSNYFHQLKHGISLWGIQNEVDGKILCRPLYFNLFANNILNRCRRAIDNSIATYSGTPTYWDINLLGNVFRNNLITNSTEYAFRNRTWADDYSIALCVYDKNISIDCETNIGDDKGLRNQVWVGNSFTTFNGGTGIKFSNDHIPALRGNSWNGFDDDYGGEEPGGILELPTRVIEALASSQALPVWNSGTEPMHWIAFEASTWLTLTANSSGTLASNIYPQASLTASGGLLNSEGDEGILSFDIGEAQAGETASIVVLAQGHEKIITVVMGQSHAVNTEHLRDLEEGENAATEIKTWINHSDTLATILEGLGDHYRIMPNWKCGENKACWEHWTLEEWGIFWQGHDALAEWENYLQNRKNKNKPLDPAELWADQSVWAEFWSGKWVNWEDWEDLFRDELICNCMESWSNPKELNDWKQFWSKQKNWKDCNCWKKWSQWEDWTVFWSEQKYWEDCNNWVEWQACWQSFLIEAHSEEITQIVQEWLTGQ